MMSLAGTGSRFLAALIFGIVLLLHLPAAIAEPPRLLFVQSIDGKQSRQLAKDTDYVVQGSPDWSPDGKQIAFDAWREPEKFSNVHMFIINADGTGLRDLGAGAMPNFSPDGKRIALSWSGVHIMNVDGTGKQLIDRSGWGAQWSPDGKMIAFGKSGNIVVYDLENKESRMILEGDHARLYDYNYWNLGWSRDSKHICFKGRRRDNRKNEVVVTNVVGSSKGFKVLLKRETNACFKWHADGKRILISMQDPMRKIFQLYMVNREEKKPQPRRFVGQAIDAHNLDADWSPDDKWIVFTKRVKASAN